MPLSHYGFLRGSRRYPVYSEEQAAILFRAGVSMRKSRIFAVGIAVIGCAYFAWTGYSRPNREAAEAAMLRDPSNFTPNYTYGGLVLASAPMEPSEQAGILGSLLGVYMKKFSAKTTRSIPSVRYVLELREKGKPVRELCKTQFGPFSGDPKPGLSALYVALLPLNGSLSESDKIKFAVFSGGASSTSVIENPFKGANSYGSPNGDLGGKDIALWGARFVPNGDGSRATDKMLVLRLDTNPSP